MNRLLSGLVPRDRVTLDQRTSPPEKESAFELRRIRVRVVLAYMYAHPSPSTKVCVHVYPSTQELVNTRISPLCSASKNFVLTM